AALINEAKKKHEEYLEVKRQADEFHRKAMEMRARIITIRREIRAKREEAKKAIEEINIEAKQALFDEKKLEEITEEALENLKKGGKISIGL
ncbi:MAG: hypothetical protein DRN25_06680, partial [Thermoplasmata archaeon]